MMPWWRFRPSSTRRVHIHATAALSAEMLGLVQHVTAYEQLAVQAAMSGDRTVALRALIAHPLIGEWSVAEPMLDACSKQTSRTCLLSGHDGVLAIDGGNSKTDVVAARRLGNVLARVRGPVVRRMHSASTARSICSRA